MTNGNFYFIDDSYYNKFDGNYLMTNKESDGKNKHNRPCYCAFSDDDGKIIWMIPISSKVEKYKSIYNKQKEKRKHFDGIRFGYVLGEERAFLIQNMFPVTAKYILNEYIDNATKSPVVIKDKLKAELNSCVRKAIRLYEKGIKFVYPNILEIKKTLLEEH